MSPPTIRQATSKDAERISRLIISLAERFILPEFTSEGREKFLTEHNSHAMERRLESGFEYHVAEDGAELLGLVGIKDRSHLFHLFVSESAQRKGLGRRLWQHALERCEWQPDLRAVTVNSSRNAVAVYESFGFEISAPEQDVGGVRYIPMKLELAAN
jgi:ribosomal protein S18 acetylase RimI-like enzyme